MITIASKSILSASQMADKANRGSHYMEVHLGGELEEMSAAEFFAKSKRDGCFDIMDIVSIHSPLMCGKENGDTILEYPADEQKIVKTMQLAQMAAEMEGHPVNVVVHTSTSVPTMKNLGVLPKVLERARRLADAFPDVELCVECHTAYDYQISPICLMPLSTGYVIGDKNVISNVELCKLAGHPRISPLMDTVHVGMIARWLQNAGTYLENDEMIALGENYMDDVMQAAAPSMKHVHFARGIGFAYGPDRHGVGFHKDVPEEYAEAEHVLSLIVDSGFDGNLVIETNEKDYLDSVNFSNTFDVVKSVLDAKGAEYRF